MLLLRFSHYSTPKTNFETKAILAFPTHPTGMFIKSIYKLYFASNSKIKIQ